MKAIIFRPAAKAFDTSMVIKADAFPEWHKRFVDSGMGVMDVVMGLANLRSAETVKDWGEKLLRQPRRRQVLLEQPQTIRRSAVLPRAPSSAHLTCLEGLCPPTRATS